MTDFSGIAIGAAIVLMAVGYVVWEMRSIEQAGAANARLLAHGELCYAEVISARESGALINDQPVCIVRVVEVQAPATEREIAQTIPMSDLGAIQAGRTVALRVDRSSGRALIDFSRS